MIEKKLFPLFLATMLIFSCATREDGFVVDGTIVNYDSGKLYLKQYSQGEFTILDTAEVQNNSFTFTGELAYPELLFIQIGENERQIASFFAENANISINLNADSIQGIKVSGSKAHDEFTAYTDSVKIYREQLNPLYDQWYALQDETDDIRQKEIEERIEAIMNNQRIFTEDFVTENTNSIVAAYLLRRELSYNMEVAELDSFIALIDTTLHGSSYMKELKGQAETMRAVAIGQPAPDFALADTSGNSLALSDLSGEYDYLLIDFWAAWCGPCRQENPNLVAIYDDYHDKGFEILGVSFDRTREEWIKAIHSDNLSWPQISDLQYWQSAAGKLYGIRSIPSNVLLNEEGVIIARNLKGDDLRNKMEELLGEEES